MLNNHESEFPINIFNDYYSIQSSSSLLSSVFMPQNVDHPEEISFLHCIFRLALKTS